MGKYTDYIMKTAQDLLSVPSPSGFTHMAADFVKKEFEKLGYEPQITQKGAVLVKLGGKDDKNAVVLAAHMDTLGGMVCQITVSYTHLRAFRCQEACGRAGA